VENREIYRSPIVHGPAKRYGGAGKSKISVPVSLAGAEPPCEGGRMKSLDLSDLVQPSPGAPQRGGARAMSFLDVIPYTLFRMLASAAHVQQSKWPTMADCRPFETPVTTA
jgi:hypothetical protein